MTEIIYDLTGKKIWVAGHKGMVGRATVRRLQKEDCTLLTVGRNELDLLDQAAVKAWLQENKPEIVVIAAAKVGGIHANSTYPAEFIYNNLMIAANIINAAKEVGTEKLLFLGSSCIYPRLSLQPIKEEYLLTGALEPTNEWYAIAKIAGIKLCQAYKRQYGCDFISAMPTNLYGPFDNYDPLNSHVVAAMIAKAHKAKMDGDKEMILWGTGTPRREFLYVDDCADAIVFLLKHYSGEEFFNIGCGEDISIGDFAREVAEVVGFQGKFVFDTTKPDGMPQKLLDMSKTHALGWKTQTPMRKGLEVSYQWYLDNIVKSL